MRLAEDDPKRGRSGAVWRGLVKTHCPPGSICALCGREIVFGLRPRHPKGPSLDHIVELWQGGHPTAVWNLQPAHLGCNVRKSNALRRRRAAELAEAQHIDRPKTKLAALRRR